VTALPETVPLRAALYARISNDPTGREAGVERQREACEELAERLGWEIAEQITDNDLSAFNGAHRPGYERLLGLIERGAVDAVVAYHPDRLYRRLRDLGRLTDVIERNRVEVRTVAAGEVDLSTASGRFTAQVLAAAAEHESARMGERIIMKHQQSREAGLHHGGFDPYGYCRTDVPGELVVVPEQAEVVREVAERLLAGETQRGITRDLNERGIRTQRGNEWTRTSLRKMMSSPRLAGFVPHEDRPAGKGRWEPILDETTWRAVRNLLDHAKRGRRPNVSLLSGLLRCGRCGGPMQHHDVGGGRRDYRCASESAERCARGVTISGPLVEDFVSGLVVQAASGANLAQLRAERTVSERQRLVLAIEEDRDALAGLAEALGKRQIRSLEWSAARAPIEARLKENETALARLSEDPLPADLVRIDGEDDWKIRTFDERRALIALFVDHVVIGPHTGRKRFDPSRIQVLWRG
jgi:DNA invertase Pin-like site-specific DNA recombinase